MDMENRKPLKKELLSTVEQQANKLAKEKPPFFTSRFGLTNKQLGIRTRREVKKARIKKISILVFIWGSLLFFLNLQYDLLDEYDIIIFWLSILLMFAIIIFQIFFIKNNTFVLFEIFIVFLLLHIIYQIGYYGLRGSDSYIDYEFVKTILHNNHFILTEGGTPSWPMLHIFTSELSMITKINPLIIAKFLPSFIASIIVMPIYLFSYNIYKDKKIALFSCVVFGTIPQFMNFEAAFVKEVFGIFIMVLFFYILYASKTRSDYCFILLSIILIPVILFAHHFTSLIVVISLGIYIVASKVTPYFLNVVSKVFPYFHSKKTIRFSGKINILTIFLVILVSIATYWVYIKESGVIRNMILQMFNDLVGNPNPNSVTYGATIQITAPIITLSGKIIFYGFLFFHFLAAVILFIKMMVIRNLQKIEDLTFTIVFYFCLAYGFLALYTMGSLQLFPDRILTFAWIFGIIPLCGLLVNLRKNILKKILVFILISFIVFNLYNIELEYYTDNIRDAGSSFATEEEYLIAQKINFPEIYYGYYGVVAAIYDVQGIEQRVGGISLGYIVDIDFQKSSTMAVISDAPLLNELENLQKKSKEKYDIYSKILSYKMEKDIDKIYDLGDIYVLRGGGIR